MLVSGGDSEILTAEMLAAGWTVYPLYVRCGFRWERAELARLRPALRALASRRLQPLTVLHAPVGPALKRHWSVTGRGVPGLNAAWASVYLPGRNMTLLNCAWLHAVAKDCSRVVIGTLKGNPFPDATPRFRRAAEKALNLAFDADVRVSAPFAGVSKAELLRTAGRFRVDRAFSCLSPRGGRPCGRCSKCGELRSARREAGV